MMFSLLLSNNSYFNPLPPHGGRHIMRNSTTKLTAISIHSLRMEGDYQPKCERRNLLNFNPLPPHGGRHSAFRPFTGQDNISIHSLRMEGDSFDNLTPIGEVISIHSLRMEGDLSLFSKHFTNVHISIHSLRMEGDEISSVLRFRQCYFNPLPPHGGRQIAFKRWFDDEKFQSTPSAWRETKIKYLMEV